MKSTILELFLQHQGMVMPFESCNCIIIHQINKLLLKQIVL